MTTTMVQGYLNPSSGPHLSCPPLNLPSRRDENLLGQGKMGVSGITPPMSRRFEGALLGGVPPPLAPWMLETEMNHSRCLLHQ